MFFLIWSFYKFTFKCLLSQIYSSESFFILVEYQKICIIKLCYIYIIYQCFLWQYLSTYFDVCVFPHTSYYCNKDWNCLYIVTFITNLLVVLLIPFVITINLSKNLSSYNGHVFLLQSVFAFYSIHLVLIYKEIQNKQKYWKHYSMLLIHVFLYKLYLELREICYV